MIIDIVSIYRERIEPLLPYAQKAYGSRDQDTINHKASREYTRLLCEYDFIGGNVPQLAAALGVNYSGVRRRIQMSNVRISHLKPAEILSDEEVVKAAVRIMEARKNGVEAYHDQLAEEYARGVPFTTLAVGLGYSSAYPLYYGVQRSLQRSEEVD